MSCARHDFILSFKFFSWSAGLWTWASMTIGHAWDMHHFSMFIASHKFGGALGSGLGANLWNSRVNYSNRVSIANETIQ